MISEFWQGVCIGAGVAGFIYLLILDLEGKL